MVLPLSTMCWRYPSGTILLYTIFKGQPESRTLSSFWIYLFYYVKFLPNGSTTLPWYWCLPTAASTLSSTPPNTMSSRRRSNVSCPSRFSQRGRSPATLEKEDNHQLILLLWRVLLNIHVCVNAARNCSMFARRQNCHVLSILCCDRTQSQELTAGSQSWDYRLTI